MGTDRSGSVNLKEVSSADTDIKDISSAVEQFTGYLGHRKGW